MIIGLTGRNAAGKGTVAQWLQNRGFGYISLSDAIRKWLASQGRDASRDNLIQGGRQLRAEGGPGVLADHTLAVLQPGLDFAVDSVRNPAEVLVLRGRPDFLLLDVRAAEAVRFARLTARARQGDAQSFAEFQRQERAELDSTDPVAQQLISTAKMADAVIDNDGDQADLDRALTVALAQWQATLSAGPWPRRETP